MGHQTKISEKNGSPETTSKGLAQEVGEFAYDIFTLAELQTQLFVADLKDCRRRVLLPGLVLISGVALGLACLPVALVAVALLIIQVFDTSYAAGFSLAVAAGAVVSVLLCVIGWLQVRRCATSLRRSQTEFDRNLRWLRKVLERNRITRGNSTDNSWRTVT